MDGAARNGDQVTGDELVRVSAAYEGDPGDIARARDLARAFLVRLQSVHGLPVSERAMDMVQLVVSELLTNACKYARGPCMLDLQRSKGRVDVTVWDSDPTLPVPRTTDPGRIGQHGLEIVMAVSQSFEVHREPVGKRTVAAIMLADDPDGNASGHQP